MGLDISVYKLLGLVENPELDEDGYLVNEDKEIKLWKHPDFPNQFDDLIDKGIYKFECLDSFRAGGYGGYGLFRATLAKIAEYKPFLDLHKINDPFTKSIVSHEPCLGGAWFLANEGPFYEQINFSDCEGYIGSITSKKLADDYAKYLDKAQEIGDRFLEVYLSFKNAFELATNNGVVSFH